MEQDIFTDLRRRIGDVHARIRLGMQAEHAAGFYSGQGMSRFHLENLEILNRFIKLSLRLSGMYGRGRRNALDYRVEETEARLPGLPAQFDGLRILQLSDLHLDGISDGGELLARTVEAVPRDVCVLTGDFRFLTYHDYAPPLRVLERLMPALAAPEGVFGILGNHDFLEMVPALEDLGVRMLLNEGVALARGGKRLWLAGVDDPHYYGAHDLPKALSGAQSGDAVVLLCHTPELYAQAAAAGVDYFLCGHTHAGQICLPGGVPVITNASCPRRFIRGAWSHKAMRGYTSRGSGASGVSVRFNCPPEITVHVLRRGTGPGGR